MAQLRLSSAWGRPLSVTGGVGHLINEASATRHDGHAGLPLQPASYCDGGLLGQP